MCAEMKEQLARYFAVVGISSDDTLKVFANKKWPAPRAVVHLTKERVDLLNKAAMLALNEVSKLTALVQKPATTSAN